jgi:hypothetical protein
VDHQSQQHPRVIDWKGEEYTTLVLYVRRSAWCFWQTTLLLDIDAEYKGLLDANLHARLGPSRLARLVTS